MNVIEYFQDLVARVPELLQPLIVAVAGAIPFVEGEGAAVIGIVGGIHPVIAVIAAIAGNFLCVLVLVLLASRAHRTVSSRVKARRHEAALVGPDAGGASDGVNGGTRGLGADGLAADATESAPISPRREKFQRALVRYGVPGVSLLGPLLLPTQFTATMLAASGVGAARILFWQGLAIVLWTTAIALLVTGVISAVA